MLISNLWKKKRKTILMSSMKKKLKRRPCRSVLRKTADFKPKLYLPEKLNLTKKKKQDKLLMKKRRKNVAKKSLMKKTLEKKMKKRRSKRELRKKLTVKRCWKKKKLKNARRQSRLKLNVFVLRRKIRNAVKKLIKLRRKSVKTLLMKKRNARLRSKLPRNCMMVFKRKKSRKNKNSCNKRRKKKRTDRNWLCSLRKLVKIKEIKRKLLRIRKLLMMNKLKRIVKPEMLSVKLRNSKNWMMRRQKKLKEKRRDKNGNRIVSREISMKLNKNVSLTKLLKLLDLRNLMKKSRRDYARKLSVSLKKRKNANVKRRKSWLSSVPLMHKKLRMKLKRRLNVSGKKWSV